MAKANKNQNGRKKTKVYDVTVCMVWSKVIRVDAESPKTAVKKGWDKFKSKPPKKLFRVVADRAW